MDLRDSIQDERPRSWDVNDFCNAFFNNFSGSKPQRYVLLCEYVYQCVHQGVLFLQVGLNLI